MKSPPIMILIENVVGFESSATQQALAEVLQECGYHFQDFLLSPTSFGTPYSRPRYFGVVRKQPFGVQKRFPTPWTCRPQTILDALAQGQIELTSSPQVCFQAATILHTLTTQCLNIREHLKVTCIC